MEILTTMITPYKADGSIDFDTAEKYVDWYYKNGLDGVFAELKPKILLVIEKRRSLPNMQKAV